ncbi:helix-turn-helix domain-containing protein [Gracilibacillus thailandensis]|uniref:Helix-turn-helix domain-containing protein n=1 Tax=Gracilibacillus thailandensis TaxID=563735 RepID=A0A6N7QSY8_9BACI|nr:helix-turn-helix transcriptional regulator [Gracilibacillus thailandensis]MRI65128.1 helix-turn-helix domain-containing protein [Gracilibacillus thailandensis]
MILENNIKIQIIQKGYKSVKDFTDKTGLSYYMVRKLANNEANSIDIELLVKLCRTLDCEIGDLFYIREQRKTG